ncbi:preprotein translocase subunit SecE [Brachybacterium squillarum]|uniref:preprotein translocase subunit SecE n=1 Tax=Brachybacterium squillarum TaxID=661979 RepID=UPI000262AB97|nr:preprotein translocase subunit SecE [Brachybacterium squillarum]
MNSSQNARTAPARGEGRDAGPRNPLAAIALFVRQVIAELRKVVVPTRRELIVYTITVLAFVAVMILIIFGLDAAFSWLSTLTFAEPE